MNIVFIHPNFPGQFRILAELLGKNKENKTIFITSEKTNKDRQIPGVQKIMYSEKPPETQKDQPPLQNPPGIPVVNVLAGLKKQDFIPDLIVGQSGTGTSFYVKDVFPQTPFLSFFEWFHSPDKIQDDFNSTAGPDLKVRMNLRNRNLSILADLCACDAGVCPSEWQKSQFPKEFQGKLGVVHGPVDVAAFQPAPDQTFKTKDLDLSDVTQLVTYTAGVLAPYKGFQQFMEALPAVLEQKPDAHVAIVGSDGVSFGDADGNKKSYKSLILEKVELDPERVHFINGLNRDDYIHLLQASDAHVYLDSPLVVSRTLLEAMACECLVVAPDIPPVKEVIKDGTNGILTDFSSPEKITEKIIACLDYPSFMAAVKQKARQAIVDTYAIEKVIPRQMGIIQKMVEQGKKPEQFG